jgi:hypothetical protein
MNEPFPSDELVPPACRPTVERLQGVLDGELPAAPLDTDPHPFACAACRQRVAAARLLASVLASPAEPPAVPPGFANRVLGAVHEDRRGRVRRRVFALAGGLAVAAAVALVVWFRWPADAVPDIAKNQPLPQEPEVAPQPRTIRIGDELTKAGWALLDAPKSITESTSAAPQVIVKVTDALTRPAVTADVESPRAAIAEIPDMARAGLEPVTGTAEKAFARLMNDIGAVRFGMKPKS